MSLTLRRDCPCGRCKAMPMCEVVFRLLGEAVERIEWVAAKTGRRLPAMEVVVTCAAFDPVRRRRR